MLVVVGSFSGMDYSSGKQGCSRPADRIIVQSNRTESRIRVRTG